MSLKRPVTLAQARRWPAAAKRRESFCARMGGMREKLTSDRVARDPRSAINQALAAWDCDEPEGLERKHVSKGIRPMKITRKMVGTEARKNPTELGTYGPFYHDPESVLTEAQIERKAESYMDRLDRLLMRNEITQQQYDRENKALSKWVKDQYAKRKRNPGRKPARTKNPRAGAQKRIVARYARVPMASINWSSMAMGDDRTPLTFVFSETEQAASSYRSYKLPDKVVKNRSFQALANALPENMMTASLEQIRDIARRFMR